jgi:TRAP-type C4-dicarboxylate transport system substrate-binding protein
MKPMHRHRRWLLLLPFLLALATPPQQASALTLKIATLAPAGSPWVDGLRRLAAEWERISGGQIEVKIYAGGIAGEEADLIRKLRLGQLQGAALTQLGLGLLEPSFLALSVPFLVQTEGELEELMGRMRFYFDRLLTAKGFRLMNLSKAGWVRFFGREPVVYPADLKRQKLGVPDGDADFVETWRRVGFSAFSLPLGDLLTGLQSGLVDAFYAPPLVAATFQWFRPARYMSDLRIAPVVGGVVLSEQFVRALPPELAGELLDHFRTLEQELNTQMVGLEEQAIVAMRQQGLKIDSVPQAAAAQWRRIGSEGAQAVIGRSFSVESYRIVQSLLEEYRRRQEP